jgi:hypothetical protein
LNKEESGNLVFTVESKASSDGQAYIDTFIEKYSKYVVLKEISDDKAAAEIAIEKPVAGTEKDESFLGGQIISEIRTSSPILPEKKYDFSKQEIIQIQTFLNKLGYYPGPTDGKMNGETMEAIEKFKAENKVIKKLF